MNKIILSHGRQQCLVKPLRNHLVHRGQWPTNIWLWASPSNYGNKAPWPQRFFLFFRFSQVWYGREGSSKQNLCGLLNLHCICAIYTPSVHRPCAATDKRTDRHTYTRTLAYHIAGALPTLPSLKQNCLVSDNIHIRPIPVVVILCPFLLLYAPTGISLHQGWAPCTRLNRSIDDLSSTTAQLLRSRFQDFCNVFDSPD